MLELTEGEVEYLLNLVTFNYESNDEQDEDLKELIEKLAKYKNTLKRQFDW